jgi:hypothetical protein
MNELINEIHQIDNNQVQIPDKKLEYISRMQDGVIQLEIDTERISHTLNKSCDILAITHIVFDVDPCVLTSNNKLTIRIGGTVMYDISFRLLTLLNKIEYKNEQYLLPINDIYINFISTGFHDSVVIISIENKTIKKINLFTKEYLLKDEKHNKFFDCQLERVFYCPESIYTTVNSAKVNYIICSHKFIDGYYLEANISNIKSISVDFWDDTNQKIVFIKNNKLIDYNVDMIHSRCKKINDKLLFIPFDIKEMETMFRVVDFFKIAV